MRIISRTCAASWSMRGSARTGGSRIEEGDIRASYGAGREDGWPSTTGEGATKIVATIADNAEKPGALDALLAAGVDVVRLNGAHAKPGDIARRTALVRRVSARRGRPVGVLLDLGGPKIRVGALPGGSVSLRNGRTVEIVPGAASEGGEKGGLVRLAVTYPALLKDVRTGRRDPHRRRQGAPRGHAAAARSRSAPSCARAGA